MTEERADKLDVAQFHRLPADQRRQLVEMWRTAAQNEKFPEGWREEFEQMLRAVGAAPATSVERST